MMGIGCVLMGTACAAIHGNTEVLPATLCMIFVVFMQMAANFYYRYYDIANSCGNAIDSRIASHSTKEPRGILKECSFACLLLAAMCGLSIATMGGIWALIVGFFIVLIVWLTVGGSMPLLRTPYGIVCFEHSKTDISQAK